MEERVRLFLHLRDSIYHLLESEDVGQGVYAEVVVEA